MNDLTDEQKRIRIAEACGWSRFSAKLLSSGGRCGLLLGTSVLGGTPPEDKDKHEDDQSFEQVPDYLNSLDAMAEARKKLSRSQLGAYHYHLIDIMDASDSFRYPSEAIPTEHAEAFLRTIGEQP